VIRNVGNILWVDIRFNGPSNLLNGAKDMKNYFAFAEHGTSYKQETLAGIHKAGGWEIRAGGERDSAPVGLAHGFLHPGQHFRGKELIDGERGSEDDRRGALRGHPEQGGALDQRGAHPPASPNFEAGPPDENSIELARVKEEAGKIEAELRLIIRSIEDE
jgi:hypothetical protein